MVCRGASGYLDEVNEDRKVKNRVISALQSAGHTVYDCTDDAGKTQGRNLASIVAKCNAHTVDLDVSIHFNSGSGDRDGNEKTTGVECYIYSSTSKAKAFAEKICQAISNLGFKNRGVKISQKLYVLKKSKAPALLVECCFVDDKDDVQLYSYEEMADAIVYGITGEHVQIVPETSKAEQGEETSTGDRKALYRVQVGAYTARYNAEAQAEKLRKAGFDAAIVQA